MQKIKLYAIIAVLVLLLGGVLFGCWRVYRDIAGIDADKQKSEEIDKAKQEAEKAAAEEQARIQAAQERIQGLQVALQEMVNGFGDGEWAIYAKNLKDGGVVDINCHQMESASLIKLYIMGAVWQAIEGGSLVDTPQIQYLLEQMITVSDNESSNRLVEALSPSGSSHADGRVVVNQFAADNGFSDTNQGRDLQDFREVEPEEKNYTSAKDCGLFLEQVYNGTCVSEEASSQMLELLKRQEYKEKIPAGLPEDIKSANKTGEVSTMEHDAAIVYTPFGDYILCVMSVNLSDTEVARQHIREISAAAYRYFREN